MIHFQLKCSKGHEFKAWFRSSNSFEDQRKRGDVACPTCGDVQISKALMTPSIAKSQRNAGDVAENVHQEIRTEQQCENHRRLRNEEAWLEYQQHFKKSEGPKPCQKTSE